MNTGLMFKSVLIALGLFFAARSEAGCEKVTVCDSSGSCRIQQVCGGMFDQPSVKPDPIKQFYRPGFAPIETPYVAPIGTTRCGMVQVNGLWKRVCQ